MLTVREAQEAILRGVGALRSARIPLLEARGFVLAEDAFADVDSPPFDNSAVDGFAVRAADTAGANPSSPVHLTMLEEVPAGRVPAKTVVSGTCTKVMTGAPIPEGADSVVMVEDSCEEGESVAILEPAERGDHVRRRGENIRQDDRVVLTGTTLGPAELGILASQGHAEVECIKLPTVAVISTGDEVIEISMKPGPGQLRNSNAYALAALAVESGAELHSMDHVRDDEAETEAALRAAAGIAPSLRRRGLGEVAADVIVTSGGVSVGERDFVKAVVERMGTLDFWRVKVKPGKPIAVGRIGDSLFFGLPGNPVSTMVTFELFVRPALRKLAGHRDVFRPRVRVTLAEGIRREPGREEYIRASVWSAGSGLLARPTGAQGSGNLSSMAGANGLIALDALTKEVGAGESVDALLLGLPLSEDPDRAQ